MMAMVWATIDEVRDYLGDRLSSAVSNDDLDKLITKAVRSLHAKVLRIPALDDSNRPANPEVRDHVIAAVSEVVAARHGKEQTNSALGAAAGVIAHGGNIKAGSLSVDGPTNSNQKGYGDERLLPWDAVEALQAAHMIGGSVPAW